MDSLGKKTVSDYSTAEQLRQRREIQATFERTCEAMQTAQSGVAAVEWAKGLSNSEFAATLGLMLVVVDNWLPVMLVAYTSRDQQALNAECDARQAEIRVRSRNDAK